MRSLILNCCLWQNKLWKGTEGIVCCVWCLIFLNHCVSVMVACVHWTNCWKANGEIDENGPLSYEQHQSAMFHFSWTDPLGHFRSDSVVFETALDCQHVHNQQESVMHNYCFSEFVEECDWQADEVVLEVFGRSRRCPLGFGSCWHCANAVVVFVLWALFVDILSDFTVVFVVWHLSSREEFLQFAEKLGEQQTPSWLGLPNNAEKVLLTILGKTSPIVVMYCYCRTEVFSCCDESCGVLLVILRMLYEVIMGEYLLNAVELVPKCSLLFVISTFEAFQHRLDLLYLVMTSPCALPFRSLFFSSIYNALLSLFFLRWTGVIFWVIFHICLSIDSFCSIFWMQEVKWWISFWRCSFWKMMMTLHMLRWPIREKKRRKWMGDQRGWKPCPILSTPGRRCCQRYYCA